MTFRSFTRRSIVTTLPIAAAMSPLLARAAQDATPATGERVVEHAAGSTTLSGDPQRVVVLEWYLLEQVLAAGIQPVGVADIAGYTELVKLPLELSDDAVDVGTRQEPSLESIAGLDPDLILADDGRHEVIYQQLSEIAPTILVPFDDRSDDVTPMDDLTNRVNLIGLALNRPEEADAALAAMNETIAAQTARLEDAGMAGIPFAIASWYSHNTDPTLRVFSNQHIVGDAVAALGIENVWEGSGEEYGFSTVSFEALITLPDDTRFIYIPIEEGGFAPLLKSDPILSSLPFVQNGLTYGLAHDTWTNPGTVGVEVLVTRVVDALTGTASDA